MNRNKNKTFNRQLTNRAWILINFRELKWLFKKRHKKQWVYRHLMVVSLKNSKQFLITHIKECSIPSHQYRLIVAPWCSGYHYCTASFNKAWTQILRRFKSCSRCVGDSRWWGSLTVVLAGNKTKRLSSVNHTPKTIDLHHQNSFPVIMIVSVLLSFLDFFISAYCAFYVVMWFKIDLVIVVRLTSMRPFKVLLHIPFARWQWMLIGR